MISEWHHNNYRSKVKLQVVYYVCLSHSSYEMFFVFVFVFVFCPGKQFTLAGKRWSEANCYLETEHMKTAGLGNAPMLFEAV